MERVEIEEASRNLAELIALARSGEEIIIAQAGKAMVRLEAIEEEEELKEERSENNSLMEEMLSAYEEEIN